MLLDIIVEPGLENWRWKDADEFQEAIDIGLISPQEAKMSAPKAKKPSNCSGPVNPFFNVWEHWHPDPSWPVPVLPDGWDVL